MTSLFQTLNCWRFWLTGVATTVTAVFGLPGNVVSIMVLMQPRMSNSFNHLLVALCVSDSIFILCQVVNAAGSLDISFGEGFW